MVLTADDTTRVAIVTGGSRRLGREVARALAGRGYAVVVFYARNQRAAEAAVDQVLAANGAAFGVRGDVADELDVERLFTEAIAAFGKIDVVVHAVGEFTVGPDAECDLDILGPLLPAHVRGTVIVSRQAARELRDGGVIVNIFGSGVGLALPTGAAGVSSEAAVEAITRVLVGEFREREVTVNAVVLTPERPGTAAELANVVAFLVSEAGHGVNGQVIRFTASSRERDTPD